jgi:hypothetical protein
MWGISDSTKSLQTGRAGFDARQRQRTFPVISVSRPVLRPTQTPVLQEVLYLGVKCGQGVRLASHPIQFRGQERVGVILLSSLAPAWCLGGQLYFTCFQLIQHIAHSNIRIRTNECGTLTCDYMHLVIQFPHK